MAQNWTLEEIVQEVRNISGRPSTSQISDSALVDRVNDFYVQRFSQDIGVSNTEGFYTVDTTATDEGEYDLPESLLRLNEPATINSENASEFTFFQEVNRFFTLYQNQDTFITPPSLSIGTDTSKVANDAFSYTIDRHSYSKAATETALSGDSVPQGKYGAWSLEAAEDGAVTIVEASGNATGYLTQRLAIDGLADESPERSTMGYVTAKNDSGVLVPGTTALTSATFTDGNYSSRGVPQASLIYENKVYLRPKPNDIYRFKAGSLERPAELAAGESPLDKSWGRAIAYGTAVELMDEKDEDIGSQVGMYRKLVGFVNRKKQNQDGKDRLVTRSF